MVLLATHACNLPLKGLLLALQLDLHHHRKNRMLYCCWRMCTKPLLHSLDAGGSYLV
jgi:hypothetical protein